MPTGLFQSEHDFYQWYLLKQHCFGLYGDCEELYVGALGHYRVGMGEHKAECLHHYHSILRYTKQGHHFYFKPSTLFPTRVCQRVGRRDDDCLIWARCGEGIIEYHLPRRHMGRSQRFLQLWKQWNSEVPGAHSSVLIHFYPQLQSSLNDCGNHTSRAAKLYTQAIFGDIYLNHHCFHHHHYCFHPYQIFFSHKPHVAYKLLAYGADHFLTVGVPALHRPAPLNNVVFSQAWRDRPPVYLITQWSTIGQWPVNSAAINLLLADLCTSFMGHAC